MQDIGRMVKEATQEIPQSRALVPLAPASIIKRWLSYLSLKPATEYILITLLCIGAAYGVYLLPPIAGSSILPIVLQIILLGIAFYACYKASERSLGVPLIGFGIAWFCSWLELNGYWPNQIIEIDLIKVGATACLIGLVGFALRFVRQQPY